MRRCLIDVMKMDKIQGHSGVSVYLGQCVILPIPGAGIGSV